MEQKNTDDLRRELQETINLDFFLAENEPNFQNISTAEMLNALFKSRKITKTALAKQAGMSEVYLHQIFSGRRRPSRDCLLCLCFGLSATLEETQKLLKLCGFAELYPKNKRDAIIIYHFINKTDLFTVNDRLFSESEKPLY